MLKFVKNNLIYLLIITTLSSCISRSNKHGYMFDLSDHEQLKEEATTRDRVLLIMGSPTLIADLNDEETWIYFAEETKNLLFFKPKVIDRKIISIKFNDDTIKELQHYNLSHQTNLEFNSEYTKVNSNKTGFFASIFSNIGQIKSQ